MSTCSELGSLETALVAGAIFEWRIRYAERFLGGSKHLRALSGLDLQTWCQCIARYAQSDALAPYQPTSLHA